MSSREAPLERRARGNSPRCPPPPLIRPWCQVQPSQKERVIGAAHCKNEEMLMQLFGWCCIESVVFAYPIHENDQR